MLDRLSLSFRTETPHKINNLKTPNLNCFYGGLHFKTYSLLETSQEKYKQPEEHLIQLDLLSFVRTLPLFMNHNLG